MSKLNIEIGENCKSSVCHCCGKESCTGHGFIYKDSNAHAVYYAGWSAHHSEKKVSLAIAIGEWGDDSTGNNRVSFGLEAYESREEILFRVIEPTESPWASTELLGKMISRTQAMSHPLLKEVFSLAEAIVRNHSSIREYLVIPAE